MDKTDRLFEALEHPERFSDDELNKILSDPETGDMYSTISKAKASLSDVPAPDVDKEWQRFARAIAKRPRIMPFFSSHAAAIFISVLVSVAAVAAGIGITITLRQENEAVATHRDNIAATTHDGETKASQDSLPTAAPAPAIITFENKSLETILNDMAQFYGVKVRFNSPEARDLRLQLKWDQSMSLDETIDMLNNFEHLNIHIDHGTIIVE